MSEHSLIIALKYGEKLKEFDDIAQAEKIFYLIQRRIAQ